MKVLYVDDCEESLTLFNAFYKNESFQYDFAHNGREALELVKKQSYALIILDMHMPVLDGYSAAKEIREWEAQKGLERTFIIALTASSSEKNGSKTREAGCDFYMAKPLRKEKLLTIIKKHLKTEQLDQKLSKVCSFSKELIDEKVVDYIPTYLSNRKEDLSHLKAATSQSDYHKVLEICHRILGSAQSYGLFQLDDLVLNLEGHAKNQNKEEVEKKIKEFEEYLQNAA